MRKHKKDQRPTEGWWDNPEWRVWDFERRLLLSQIRRAARLGLPTEDLETQLIEHYHKEPRPADGSKPWAYR